MNIAILGFGTVGKGVYEIINRHDTLKTKNIIVKRVLVRDKNKKGCESELFATDFNDILNDNDIDLVVECIGNVMPAYEYIKKSLGHEKLVVTSNKMLLATNYKNLVKMHKDRIKYEATVCGGIHVFHAIDEIRKVDKIKSFTGIVNGTTNYILSNMSEKNVSFEEALNEAKKLGFAEADPTSDIAGFDAFYKAILLHNEIFDDDIETSEEVIFEYIKNNKLVGINNVTSEDILNAKRTDKTIKLIAYGDKDITYVKPMLIDNNNYFSRVNGNINCLTIESDNLGISSYIGAGAGRFPTAHAIVLDICDFIR